MTSWLFVDVTIACGGDSTESKREGTCGMWGSGREA